MQTGPGLTAPDFLLEPLLNHGPAGVVLAGPDGQLEYLNPKAIRCLAPGGTAPEPGTPLTAIPAAASLLERVDLGELFRRAQPITCHTVRQTAGRDAAAIEGTLIPLYDDEDAPRGLLLVLLERPLPHEAERDVVLAEKYSALNTVIAGVAHELNNPLTAILGTAQILLTKEKHEPVRKRLNNICESADRCSKIVANLLSFSQRYRMVKAPTNINHVLEDTVSLCRYHIELDGITIQLRLDPSAPLVPVQALEMQRVFLSLINNAHQAMRAAGANPGSLVITTAVVNNMLRVTFADNGPGVPRDIRGRIFDPFFSTRELGDGMGLGLSVAYGVVRDHQGHLWLETADGAGATFLLDLPLEDGVKMG